MPQRPRATYAWSVLWRKPGVGDEMNSYPSNPDTTRGHAVTSGRDQWQGQTTASVSTRVIDGEADTRGVGKGDF
jgi:hypothetical protein